MTTFPVPLRIERPHHDRASLVTLMLTTLPGVRMRRRDAARLGALVRKFEHAIDGRAPRGVDIAPRLERLRSAAEAATRQPTRRALAIFVDEDWDHTVTLPQAVFDRVVLDSHFDTRDLLYAEQFFPPFRVLAVDDGQGWIYDSHDDSLIERHTVHQPPPSSAGGISFAHLLVEHVEAIHATDPRPLVLACRDDELTAQVAANLPSWVGDLGETWSREKLTRLHRAARLRVGDWCGERARTAIPYPGAPGWTFGSENVQRAVAADPRGLMLLEAHKNDGPHRGIHVVHPPDFGSRPTGINAAVARVRAGGGRVQFVEDGDLRDFDGVAYCVHDS